MRSGLLAMIAVTALSSGCAQVAPVGSERLDPATSAVVGGATWGGVYRGGSVTLESVDAALRTTRQQSRFAVAPGRHTARASITLCTGRKRPCQPLAFVAVPFEAQAGREYAVHAQELVYGRLEFRVWVEDAHSGQMAGEALTHRDA